jgi:hypothetical protein
MTTALVGLAGVVFGLAVGFGYRFWAARRSELAEAVVATAVVAAQLRMLNACDPGRRAFEAERLRGMWEEQRRWLILHMRPADFETLAESVPLPDRGSVTAPFGVEELIKRVASLNRLFWRPRASDASHCRQLRFSEALGSSSSRA